MGRQNIHHLIAIFHWRAVWQKFNPQNPFLVGVVPCLDIVKAPGFRGVFAICQVAAIANRPAGKGAGHFVDVQIKIALRQAFRSARHRFPVIIKVVQIVARPKRMQFQQLSRPVFICGRCAAVGVIKVIQHRRGPGHVAQQVTEIAQGVCAHDCVMAGEKNRRVFVFLRIHTEMIMPELRQHFAQLRRRVNGPDHGCRNHFDGWPGALGIIHALFPVDAIQLVRRVIVQGSKGPQFIQRLPILTVFIRSGVVGNSQPRGSQTGIKAGICHGHRQLGFQPGQRIAKRRPGVWCGPEGKSVQPKISGVGDRCPQLKWHHRSRHTGDQTGMELAACQHFCTCH